MSSSSLLWAIVLLATSIGTIDTNNPNDPEIFEKPGSVLRYVKNECFADSGAFYNWLVKQTGSKLYNRHIRPGIDGAMSRTLQINISIDMNSIASVDALNSEYKILLKIDLEWFDERLQNDCSKTPVTMQMDVHHLARVWRPKFGVPNIKDSETSIIEGEPNLILAQLRTDGYFHVRSSVPLNLFCNLDFEFFPFDTQECFIKLESYSYEKEDIVLRWRDDQPFRNLESLQITGFSLKSYQLYNDSNINTLDQPEDIYVHGGGSQLIVKLFISREWTNYFLEIYLPSVLFVMISWLSFWMNINSAPARVSLGMTTMLTMVTGSRATRDKSPRISNIQAVDIWIAFCTCFIFLSLGEFALVSYIYNRADRKAKKQQQQDEEMERKSRKSSGLSSASSQETERLASSDNITRRQLALISRLNHVTINLEDVVCPCHAHHQAVPTKNCLQRLFQIYRGERLAFAIDRWCRVVFPLSFIIFNIGYWCYYLK